MGTYIFATMIIIMASSSFEGSWFHVTPENLGVGLPSKSFSCSWVFSRHPTSAFTDNIAHGRVPARSYSSMSLCQYCNSIPAKLFSFRRDTQGSHDHQPNLSALKKSAAGGCRGCGLFLHAVESSTSDHA